MGTNNIIVREYLESLSEDRELDRIFPLLLNLMGFKLISTPKDSKGQPQYGKDIVAIRKDPDEIWRRYYFELKGHTDKDIDDTVFFKTDGIRESLLAAKDADFNESGIKGFSSMPKKIVLVHNGILKANTRPIFNGFIDKNFQPGEFERWDIHELTDLFSKYLFGEYLLTDDHSIMLFKKTLVLLDVPDYDLKDFKELIDKLLENEANVKTRSFRKMFTTLNLLSFILFHYSAQADNLEIAKKGLPYLVLQTWGWILKNKLETRQPVIKEFRKLLRIYHDVLNEYFKKTLPVTLTNDGLFSERGGPAEEVGYPLRAMEYLSYFVYFCLQRHYWPKYQPNVPRVKKRRLESLQKEVLFKIIDANDGCVRPLLDRYSLPLLLVFIFCKQNVHFTKKEEILLHNYLVSVLDNLALIFGVRKRFPEFTDNIDTLVEFVATAERPDDYSDKSSHLFMILIEVLAILNDDELYQQAREFVDGKVDLQTANPILSDDVDIEQRLFEGNTHEYMTVDTSRKVPTDIKELQQEMKSRTIKLFAYRTDAAGFPFLRYLSAIYYHNDIFPDEWRQFTILATQNTPSD